MTNVTLDKSKRSVTVDGKPAHVTMREYQVLCVLSDYQRYTTDEIMLAIYGDTIGGAEIAWFVRRLRLQGIEIDSKRFLGYLLTSDITVIEREPEAMGLDQ